MKTARRNVISLSIVFVLVLTVLVQILPISSNAEETAEYDTSIMKVKGGANAIATMTFDDGVYSNDSLIESLVSEYGLKATLMVVPNRIMNYSGYTSLNQLQAMIDNGTTDVQSHSYTHLYIAPEGHADYTAENNTDANRYREIVGSKEFLSTALNNTTQLGFAVPGGTYDDAAMDLVMQTYYSARTYMSASSDSPQSLTPSMGKDAGGWYGIKSLWLSAGLETVSEYLDTCVNSSGWFFTGAHNIVESSSMWDMTPEDFEQLLARMQQYQNEGKLWVATYSDAIKYLREYESATVTHTSNANGMYIGVTMADTTPDGLPLSTSVFNMPLTVKAEIPEGWTSVRLSRGSESQIVESFTEGDKTYIYFDTVPNSGSYLVTNADEELSIPTSLSASFSQAYGGASSIATMTFDDGAIHTAYELKNLCVEYDCKASLMLIPKNNFLNSDGTQNANAVAMWSSLFDGGYLSPESHSQTHAYLDGSVEANLNTDMYNSEIKDSLFTIRDAFPGNDVLTFALPYSSYVDDAYEVVMQNYYAARSGICVLYHTSYADRMQSLNPTAGKEAGGWYNPIGIRLMPEQSYTNITLDGILAYLDKCVENEGWFISMAHGLVESENYDISPDDLAIIMSRMQKYSNEGKLWVATYTDATKYIRERQNSTVTAVATDLYNYTVKVGMNEETAEGLPLDSEIFNMPLTVKLEIPACGSSVTYSQNNGEKVTVPTFTDNGLTYAYIDVVPNGTETSVTVENAISADESEDYVGKYTAPDGAWTPESDSITYATFASEDDYINGNSCIGAYEGNTIDTANIIASGVGYVHLFDHVSVATLAPTFDLVIDLGGYSLTMKGVNIRTTGVALSFKNGMVVNTGSISTRAKSQFITDNVNFIHNYAQFGTSPATTLWHFKDSIIELCKEESYFALGHYNLVATEGKVLFENTDIKITGSVHSEYGLFHFMGYQNANAGTSHYKVILDKDSSVIGNVPIFASCYEMQYGSGANYYGFGTPMYINIEYGCTFSTDARPDFKYYFYDISQEDGSFISYTQKTAGDEILKMQVVKPGTDKVIPGDPFFVSTDEGYSITVVNSPVGTYNEPMGAYKPADGVTFALWSTESEYINGLSPIKEYNVTTIDSTIVTELVYGGYVHFFTDVTLGAKFIPNEKTPTIFDLGGNTLTCNYATEITNSYSTFTVKNGFFDCTTRNSLRIRGSSSLIFDNVHVTYDGSIIGYASIFKLFKFKDCILELNGENTFFYICGNYAYDTLNIVFENTDIVINGSVNSNYGLFCFREDIASPYNGGTVLLDKDSSITGEVSCLASFSHRRENYAMQHVYIELGFTISNNSDISAYFKQNTGFDDANIAEPSGVTEDANTDYIKVTVVYPGTTNEVIRYNLKQTEDGSFAYREFEITYATYESENAYINGDDAIGEFDSDLTSASIMAEGVGYVIILSDNALNMQDKLSVYDGRTIVIDLGESTLNNSMGLSITNGSAITIKNGVYNYTDGQISQETGTTVIFDSIEMNVTNSYELVYINSGTLFAMRNCTVTLNDSNNHFSLFGSTASGVSTLEFTDTTIEVNAVFADPLFKISEASGAYNPRWEIRISGTSSVVGTGSAVALVGLYEGFDTDTAVEFTNLQKVYIGNGFTFNSSILESLVKYCFGEVDLEASTQAGEAVYKENVYLSSDDIRCKFFIGGIDANDNDLIFIAPDSSKELYTVSRETDNSNVIYYRLDSETGFYVGTIPSSYDTDGYPIFGSSDLQSLKANEIIYFAQDFILNARTAPSSSQSVTNFIFDLGGNTFYLRGQMNLSISGINYSFTFRNGTIDATQAGSFSGNPNDTGVFTFDNVYINYTGTGQFFNTYGGILVLKNSTFYGASGYLISFDVANKYFSLQISDSTVTAKRVIRTMRINAVSELDYDEFFIKNSVINVSEYLMQVVNAQSPTQDNYINFDITGSKITAPIIMQVAANTVGIAKVRMSNTYLAKEAKIQIGTVTGEGTDAFSLDIATGERIMEISGVEGYSYLINKVPLSQGDFTANLTLYSDFTINFFANSDRIKEVQLNGNTLSGEAYGDSTKYTIPDIAPYSAANDLSFTVIIENNGITYKVPLAYSILKYANTVIAGNYTDADKQLVSAVMAYIVSAYEYTDNTAPEFSGVEYSSAEIGEAEAFSHEAISSVQLSLGSGVKVRFNLKSDYYGKLIVGDTVYEIDKDAPGTVGAVNYVTVNLRAYELYNNGIEVSDASGTSVYTLANYVEFANNYGDTKLIALIDALVDYSYYASESKNSYREEK